MIDMDLYIRQVVQLTSNRNVRRNVRVLKVECNTVVKPLGAALIFLHHTTQWKEKKNKIDGFPLQYIDVLLISKQFSVVSHWGYVLFYRKEAGHNFRVGQGLNNKLGRKKNEQKRQDVCYSHFNLHGN